MTNIIYLGSFASLADVALLCPNGAQDGNYVSVGETIYTYDSTENDWIENTNSSITVSYLRSISSLNNLINYLGSFATEEAVWTSYPEGGYEGDYVRIDGVITKWNVLGREWGEDSGDESNAIASQQITGDLNITHNLIVAGSITAANFSVGQAQNARYWDSHLFSEYLNQTLRTTDNVQFVRAILNRIESDNYVAGTSGFKIANNGDAELGSLALRGQLNAPEIRNNRVLSAIGTRWSGPGYGEIASVTINHDAGGNELTTGTVTLRLVNGESPEVTVGDLCLGIFHDADPLNNASDDYDDSRGNFLFKGFFTAYFKVIAISGSLFTYELRPQSVRWAYRKHPCALMKFVVYGNATNTARQASQYTAPKYTRYLKGVNTWEISSSMITAQFGDLTNLSVHGITIGDKTAYLQNPTSGGGSGTDMFWEAREAVGEEPAVEVSKYPVALLGGSLYGLMNKGLATEKLEQLFELVNLGTTENPNWAIHTPLALYSDLDISVGVPSSSPSADGVLYGLADVYGDIQNAYVKRADGTQAQNGDVLSFNSSVSGGRWVALAGGGLGTITGATMNGSSVPVSSGILQLGTVITSLTPITDLIPSEASSSNQLADKAFVNSSISTNTAKFQGTFETVADLPTDSTKVSNNDYAFVISVTAQGNPEYNRYKATVNNTTVTWAFEYTLNNSSFTASQWAAIQSGITSSKVSGYDTHIATSGDSTIHHTHSNKATLDAIPASLITLLAHLDIVTPQGSQQSYLHTDLPLYSDQDISVGIPSGGGGGGTTLEAVWETLTNESAVTTYNSTRLHWKHIVYDNVSGNPQNGQIPVWDGTKFIWGNAASGTLTDFKFNGTSKVSGGVASLTTQDITTAINLGSYLTIASAASTYQPIINSSNKLAYSLISGTPTTLPNPYALTFGSKTYDGSAAKTILASDLGALTAITKAMVEDVLTGNISSHTHSYLPLSGGTLTGTVKIEANYGAYVKNFTYPSASGWARNIVELRVDDVTKFRIGAYGVYTPGASDNGIDYAYIGCYGFDGLNLRISSNSLKWGDNAIYHAGNANLVSVAWTASQLTLGSQTLIDTNIAYLHNLADKFELVTEGGQQYLHAKLPLYSDYDISVGIPSGGGGGGTTLAAVWESLTTNGDEYANYRIHAGHIFPTLVNGKILGVVNGAIAWIDTPASGVTSIGGATGAITLGANLSISGGVLSATDTTYSDATTSVHGLLSAADKTKINSLGSFAYINSLAATSLTDYASLITTSNIGTYALTPSNYAATLGSVYAPYNATGYLPLSGGTMSGSVDYVRNNIIFREWLSDSAYGSGEADYYIQFRTASNYNHTKMVIGALWSKQLTEQVEANLAYIFIGSSYDSSTNLRVYSDSVKVGANTIYHAGNCNNTSTAWSASMMTVGSGTPYNPALSVMSAANGWAAHFTNGTLGILLGVRGGCASVGSFNATNICIGPDGGNVGIGTTNPSVKLDVAGAIYSSVDVSCASDIRLKTNISKLPNVMSAIGRLDLFYHDWIDKRSGLTIGLSAQQLLDSPFSCLVRQNNDGYYSVAYEKLTIVALKGLQEHENEINDLKARVTYLENKLRENNIAA